MTEYKYVEEPILLWLCEPTTGLGWTFRGEEEMAAFDRPLRSYPRRLQGSYAGEAPRGLPNVERGRMTRLTFKVEVRSQP